MKIVEDSLAVDLETFLERPLFCFLGTVTRDGHPRVSPLWFLWEETAVWILADLEGKSYPDRVERRPETALAVVDFDVRDGRVAHVGMRGRATIEPLASDRAFRLLERYLGPRPEEWDSRFVDLDSDRWAFLRFDPDTVVARDQSFAPSLE